MTPAACAEQTAQLPLLLFWLGAIALAVWVRSAHGLTWSETLRAMVGLSVPRVTLAPVVMWLALALAGGVVLIWLVAIRRCLGEGV